MSLARPLARAARVRVPTSVPAARALSGSAAARADTDSEPISIADRPADAPPLTATGRDPLLAPRVRDLTKADLHTPIVYRHQIPRTPGLALRFGPDAPLAEHINYPHRLFERPWSDEDLPESAVSTVDMTPTLAAVLGLPRRELMNLARYNVVTKRVVNMTKMGKIPSWLAFTIVGSPERGLVGFGRGRGDNPMTAADKARNKAMLSMDYVDRFENRTVWGQGADLTSKYGASIVTIRARPPGFGLQVPHILHRLFQACGIRDASATIEGSRNEVTVINAAIQILHGGFGPPGLGSGKGTSGSRENKGAGMRSTPTLQRQRGRYAVGVGSR